MSDQTTESIPIRPVNGRVLVKQLPYRPSKIIQVLNSDKACENEGIVVAISPHRYGRKRTRGGWENTHLKLDHEVQVGDRVLFPGKYQDDDVSHFNGVKHRFLESWEILAILDRPQPEGYTSVITGESTPEETAMLIR